MELISGLPDDIVRECLARVSYDQLSTVASVCKGWKAEIQLPEFRRTRKASGQIQTLIVMAQAGVDLNRNNSGLGKHMANPVYGLTVFEPGRNVWTDLPLHPELSGGLPMFCQLISVGYYLVVMGGWDPITWEASTSVFIYNFMSSTWHRGADMPGGPRTFFACASDGDLIVYIAGGHDKEKNALRSAMAYDVARDVWWLLNDMARERDESKGIFHRGKFHVIGGYSTDMQGQFESSAEAFDAATQRWNNLQEDFLGVRCCPRTCVGVGSDDDDQPFLICRGHELMTLKEDGTWQEITQLPQEIYNLATMITWQPGNNVQGTLLLVGSAGFGVPHVGFILDLKNCSWKKLEMGISHSGHVQSSCLLEI